MRLPAASCWLLTVTKNCQSCPLANSRYATVRQHPTKDTIYLYIKTIERIHTPSKMWEKNKQSNNYNQALEQIEERLKARYYRPCSARGFFADRRALVLSEIPQTQKQKVRYSKSESPQSLVEMKNHGFEGYYVREMN